MGIRKHAEMRRCGRHHSAGLVWNNTLLQQSILDREHLNAQEAEFTLSISVSVGSAIQEKEKQKPAPQRELCSKPAWEERSALAESFTSARSVARLTRAISMPLCDGTILETCDQSAS